MNDDCRAAISRADAQIARAQDWIDLRLTLYRRVNNLPSEVLVRLVKVTAELTPDELLAALGYAEGLAAWSRPAQESGDATLATEGPEAGAPG